MPAQSRITILFLISSEGRYGIENMLTTLASNLVRLRCHCIVGVFCDSRYPHLEVAEEARRRGLPVEIISCRGKWDWGAVARIRQLITEHDVSLLHPHGYKADVYAYAAALGNRVGLIATTHNWPNKRLNMRAYAVADRLILRRFDRVIAVSAFVAQVLRWWGVPQPKLATIYNGIDINEFENAAPNLGPVLGSKRNSVVGFVGRLIPDKGGSFLLQAAEKVLAALPDTKFVFCGDGPCLDEWHALASRLGIAEHVIFAGQCSDMPGAYASMDIVVLPSLVESMPMCLLEAMAAGKPVIASEVGGVPTVVLPGETGLLTRPGDVQGLAAAMLHLIQNPEIARQWGANGRTRVINNFSGEAMAKSYIAHYRDILAEHKEKQNQPALEMGAR